MFLFEDFFIKEELVNNTYSATLITMISLLIFVSSAWCQDYAAILGDDDTIEWVFRIEVIDSRTHTPIKNAQITLREESSRSSIFSIETDATGVGVVLVKEVRYIPGLGKLKIVAPGYYYWEKEIRQWDLFEKENDVKLYLPGMKYDWTFTSRPNDKEVMSALRNGKYEIWNRSDIIFYGPGCFEFKVEMKNVPKKIDLE